MNSYVQYQRHESPKNMLLESLDELLFTADYCIRYRKTNREIWCDPHHSKYALGMPAAIMLFSIVDSIGSYFRANSNVKLNIQVDGKASLISKGVYRNFYILNSDYFGLSLTDSAIKKFYDMGRSRLMHNSVLGREVTLSLSKGKTFFEVNEIIGKGRYVVHLEGFYQACKKAVSRFKGDIENIVPHSFEGKDFKE